MDMSRRMGTARAYHLDRQRHIWLIIQPFIASLRVLKEHILQSRQNSNDLARLHSHYIAMQFSKIFFSLVLAAVAVNAEFVQSARDIVKSAREDIRTVREEINTAREIVQSCEEVLPTPAVPRGEVLTIAKREIVKSAVVEKPVGDCWILYCLELTLICYSLSQLRQSSATMPGISTFNSSGYVFNGSNPFRTAATDTFALESRHLRDQCRRPPGTVLYETLLYSDLKLQMNCCRCMCSELE